MNHEDTIETLLAAVHRGEDRASETLLSRVYAELHRLAEQVLAEERSDVSVQATILVHDAWLRLVAASADAPHANRRYFFAAAARSMRQILVDRARARQAQKRGGQRQRVDVPEFLSTAETEDGQILALHEALAAFEAIAPEPARVVELRWFAGLSVEQTAALLERSPATVKREWTYARAWLHDRLTREDEA